MKERMTMTDLVKKLMTGRDTVKDGYDNGGYAVIGDTFSKMARMAEYPDAWEADEDLSLFMSYYDNLQGVIWGLYAACYISEKQRKDLLDELSQIFNKFLNAWAR